MQDENPSPFGWARRLAFVAVVLSGLATIVGSGGGGGAECSFFSNVCNPVVGPFSGPAIAYVYPQRISVQAGGNVTVSVDWSGIDAPSFQWRRSADAGQSYLDIAGATGTSLALDNVQLSDNGVQFQVDVRSNGVSVLKPGGGRLAVSSLPGVVLQDGEFQPADWVVTATAVPTLNGPVATDQRATPGGNPGAYRSMTYTMTAGPSSLRVLHAAALTYTPSAQGAIYVIDFAEDCIVSSVDPALGHVDSSLLIVQAARSYTSKAANTCADPKRAWQALPLVSSLAPADLQQVDGPACSAAESCPDFSANGPPLRFGFVRAATVAASSPAGSITHGIDNWKVTVWRR